MPAITSSDSSPAYCTPRRQLTNRRLATRDHEELIVALSVLQNQSLIEFNDAVMETMSRTQQVGSSLPLCLCLGRPVIG
jgi:hypothetical protein